MKHILVCLPQGERLDTFFDVPLKSRLMQLGHVHWNTFDRQITQQELTQHLQGIDICVTGWDSPNFIEGALVHADKLSLIAHVGGTIRPMITDAVFQQGIRVCCGNLEFARSVAEGVVAYMLFAMRRIPAYQQAMEEGRWPFPADTRGLMGKRVGLVGYGMIGEAVASLLKAFGCEVWVSSRHRKAEAVYSLKEGAKQMLKSTQRH